MPTVTALRAARPGRLAVELDGVPWRVLPVEVVGAAGLHLGCVLDRERARSLARARRRTAALSAAAGALRRRALTERELDERLARRRIAAQDRAAAASVLGSAGYLDDPRFAAARAASLADRDSGDALIRHDLESRGIEAETIDVTLAGLTPECERARRIVERRGPGPPTARRLASRGFSEDAVELALGHDVAQGGDGVVG